MISQKQAVLAALRSAPDGLCVSDMNAIDWTAVLTMRNRISELRQEYVIRGERCRKHAHRGQVERYTLIESVVHVADRRQGIAPVEVGGKKLRESRGGERAVRANVVADRRAVTVGGMDRASRLVPNGREIHATATGTLGSINVTASQSAPCLVTAPVQQTLVMS